MTSSALSAMLPGAVRLSAENTAVVLDSTADLPDPPGRHPNWRLVPLYVRFGDETFREYLDISAEEFYRRLRSSSEPPKSSQPSPADFEAAFAELSGYERILCVLLSAKISGTYESARLAAEAAGDGRVHVIDSGVTSGGTVILADAIQRRLEAGTDEEEIDALVERFRRDAGLIFTLETLEFLAKGGRIGKASHMAGNLLNIKPILTFEDGEVLPLKRVRGNRRAFKEFEDAFLGGSSDEPGLRVGIAHADAPERMEALKQLVEATRPQAEIEVATSLGPVLGTHAGPGTVGFFWWTDPD
jgi:DegV family protein with EDD domain